MTRFSIVPALALLLTTARGDDEPPQRLYRTEVFTLPRAEAAALLAQPLDGTALHAKLVEAAAKREALLEKLLFIKSQCGAQSSVEQTDHFEYPTENDPAQATQTLVLVNPEPGKADHAPDPATKETVSPFNAGLGTLTTTTPTAFEMRPLGDSLELDCSAEGVLHYKLSSTEWLATDHLRDVPLPVFGTRSLEGETRLKPGQTAFLGTYSHARNTGVKGQRDAGKVALAFITATEAPVPKPAEQPVIFKHASLRATLEILSMDKAAEHTLVLETHDEQKIYERLVQHGTRDSTLSARGTLGTRLRVSNADEFISPVEFDPPQIAGKLIIADSQLIKDLRSGRQTGLGNPQTVDGGNPNGGFGFITTVSPTAFEMHPLGESMEIEVTEGDLGIEAQIGIHFTRLSGTVPYTSIHHPIVETRRLVVSIRAAENRRQLLGTLNKPFANGLSTSNKEDRVWFAFLRLTK